MEKNRFQLEDGLELRVEPSFNFEFNLLKKDEQGYAKIEKRKKNSMKKCLDISLYLNKKLCLSPCDNYYNLQNYEKEVTRDLKIEKVKKIMIPVAKKIVEEMHSRLLRAYEVSDADISGTCYDYESYDYIRLSRKINNLKHDVLLTISDSDVESDLIEDLFVREYPVNRMPDKLLGNVFSVYFLKPDSFENSRAFEKAFIVRYNPFGDNSKITPTAVATLMSLSYGYRMRTIGIPKEKILKILINEKQLK